MGLERSATNSMWWIAQSLVHENLSWNKVAEGRWKTKVREHTCELVRQADGRYFFHIGVDQPRTFASILDLPSAWDIPELQEGLEND